jgi:hypothetical protein
MITQKVFSKLESFSPKFNQNFLPLNSKLQCKGKKMAKKVNKIKEEEPHKVALQVFHHPSSSSGMQGWND